MKFDVVVGNPPYQKSDGGHGASARAIYNEFVQKAKEWDPEYLSFVIPARWMVGGKGMNKFRKEMLSDEKIELLKIFPNSKECFPDNDIMGGICYFLRAKNHSGDCTVVVKSGNDVSSHKRKLNEIGDDIFVVNKLSIDIIKKVAVLETEYMNDAVSSRKPFALATPFRANATNPFKDSVKLYQNGGIGYVDKADIPKNKEWIDDYKVLIPYAYGCSGGIGAKVIGSPFVAPPGTACTETYLVVNRYDNIAAAENMVKFLKTKFVRFLVSIVKKTQHGTKTVYRFVPSLDTTKEWADQELYERYNLTQEEIDFIEKKIKEMK